MDPPSRRPILSRTPLSLSLSPATLVARARPRLAVGAARVRPPRRPHLAAPPSIPTPSSAAARVRLSPHPLVPLSFASSPQPPEAVSVPTPRRLCRGLRPRQGARWIQVDGYSVDLSRHHRARHGRERWEGAAGRGSPCWPWQ
jgi:hypothetical protein